MMQWKIVERSSLCLHLIPAFNTSETEQHVDDQLLPSPMACDIRAQDGNGLLPSNAHNSTKIINCVKTKGSLRTSLNLLEDKWRWRRRTAQIYRCIADRHIHRTFGHPRHRAWPQHAYQCLHAATARSEQKSRRCNFAGSRKQLDQRPE